MYVTIFLSCFIVLISWRLHGSAVTSVVNNPDVCVPRVIPGRGEPSARWDRREAR